MIKNLLSIALLTIRILKKNYSGSLNETEMDFLEDRTGATHNTVKVIFSNAQEKFE